MDYVLILLRLFHIVVGVMWVGIAASIAFYIAPTVLKTQQNGLHYLKSLLTGTRFSAVLPTFAGMTMLAGILLYIVGDVRPHFSDDGHKVLGLGALVGIIAGIHSGAVTRRNMEALGRLLGEKVKDNPSPIAAEVQYELQAKVGRLVLNSRITFVLTLLALTGMASARYI